MSSALDHVRYSCGIAGEEVAEYVDAMEKQIQSDSNLIEQFKETIAQQVEALRVAAAYEALSSIDDYAKMNISVDAMGPRKVLEQFIADVEKLAKIEQRVADEIASLKVERDKAWSINPTVSDQLLLDQLTKAQAELESLRKDAERFKWVSNNVSVEQSIEDADKMAYGFQIPLDVSWIAHQFHGTDIPWFCEAIDAAIAAAPKEK